VAAHNGSASDAHHNGINAATAPRAWVAAVIALSLALVLALALLAREYSSERRNRLNTAFRQHRGARSIPYLWKGSSPAPKNPGPFSATRSSSERPLLGCAISTRKRRQDANPRSLHRVGEVLAIHNLDLVFAALHQSLRVKRGSLFSLDDAKNNDLIFIGSPGENLTLLEIPSTKEFFFRRVQDGPHAGRWKSSTQRRAKGRLRAIFKVLQTFP